MMKLEQSQHSSEDILQIINNVNRKYQIGRSQYLLLIKRQKDKDYCTLYITDCEATFWIKKVDKTFLHDLKEGMNINTELNVFSGHFGRNLKNNSKLVVDGDEIRVEIELKIGQGLMMSCKFNVQNSIVASDSPYDFKMVLRNFLKQLYEAKQRQIQFERQKWSKLANQEVKNRSIQNPDPKYVKEVLNGLKKDANQLKPKNRNLMNPNNKKRKQTGVKFQGDNM